MGRYFGTDGVRGVANADLTPDLVLALARAGTLVLARDTDSAMPVVIARDTRLSGPMLEAAAVAGVTSAGRDALVVGVVPTPGLARIVTAIDAAAGIMISASHNPVEDNGVKFFGGDGYKLSDEREDEIERALEETHPLPTHDGVGRVRVAHGLVDRYFTALIERGGDLSALTIVVDAAFGAAYAVGPRIFARLGARVVAMNAVDDGSRINVACGATHLTPLVSRVREIAREDPSAHVVGVAFDGDADRAMFVAEDGSVLTGDHVLLLLARDFRVRGILGAQTVVGTVMANLGLVHALEAEGIAFERTPVGDRYVLEAMLANGATLGGEQSGHVIDLGANTTGDGPLTAVSVFSALARSGGRLTDLARELRIYPQVLVNVRTEQRTTIAAHPRVVAAIDAVERELGSEGRILVRPSGTEPLVRVMVEGPERGLVERLAAVVAAAVEAAAG